MQQALRQYSDNLGLDGLSIDETPCSGKHFFHTGLSEASEVEAADKVPLATYNASLECGYAQRH